MTVRTVTLAMPPSDPTKFYRPGEIVASFRRPRHPFGLGAGTDCPAGQVYDYTLQACRPAMGSSPSNETIVRLGVGSVLGVSLLGLVGTGLAAYFVYRVAKKQKWI